MAVSIGEQIHALTGFDGDSSDSSEIGENYDDVTAEWMNVAVREVVNVLPLKLKHKCSTLSVVNATNGTTLDLDGIGEVLSVTRLSANSGGYHIPCREVHPMYGDLTNDSTSIHYATVTDPAYWSISNSSDAATLFVKPTATDAQPANVYHISYPVFDADGSGSNINIKTATSIANFPDEAEYLVVLRAAITAAEYLLAIEEDTELYIPVISNLRKEYNDGLSMLMSRATPKKSKKLGDIEV